MIFDHVLNSAFDLDDQEDSGGYRFPRICEHCHRRIEGKQYQIGKYFYDAYCYKFRWVIEMAKEEEEIKMEIKKRKALEG